MNKIAVCVICALLLCGSNAFADPLHPEYDRKYPSDAGYARQQASKQRERERREAEVPPSRLASPYEHEAKQPKDGFGKPKFLPPFDPYDE